MTAPRGAAGGCLGIDIGGTKVGLRIETMDGDPPLPAGPAGLPGPGAAAAQVLQARAGWPAAGGVEADLAVLRDLVRGALADWGRPVAAVGVAVPGTVAPDGTLVTWPGRPSWAGLDLGVALRSAVPAGLPIGWADDGDLGALAEARAAGCDDLVYLGVGTGVGGGIVAGGRVLPGFARGSCELGHLVVDLDGPVCGCGRRGCVQAFAGGPAILRRAAAERGRDTTPDELREGWHRRESWAVTALDAAALALGAAVIGVSETVHPDLALIGGGFAAAHDGLVELVAGHVSSLTRPGGPDVEVRPAALGGLSSLRGAVELARDLDPL